MPVAGKLMQLDQSWIKFWSNFAIRAYIESIFETIRHQCFESIKICKSFLIIDYIKILIAPFDLNWLDLQMN